MDTGLSQEKLREILDRVMRNVTEKESGILLHQEKDPPRGDLYTVYIVFDKGFRHSVSMCAEENMFKRIARHMMQEERVEPQDVEDCAKEYCNVLCGHIAAELYRATKVASRFGLPVFGRGNCQPQNHRKQFEISYSSDRNEWIQLIHHTYVPE
ncbi:MAG: chemotaxis protein CheX [Lachnospiraceae bacterium]|nr:chemotaxis protein CheX [Lachnospiraceae bacterium]